MATTADNLYQDVKTQLTEFKTFIGEPNLSTIRTVISAVRQVLPQVDDFLNKLIDLMGKIKDALKNLNINIPGVDKITTFTQKVTTLLQTVLSLVPSESDAINTVLGIAKVVGGLPDLGKSLIDEIGQLIDAIVTDLRSLLPA